MKVFISWSGEGSKKIAETLKKWIKNVIQSIEPFVSSEDIQTGERWSENIARELKDSNFGILCVTKDNFKAPWLLFEAGALSKEIDNKSFVVPLLFGIKPSDLSKSPLLQFQSISFSKDEIRKLMNTLNDANGKTVDNLDEVFEKWYPDLEKDLDNIISSNHNENENVDKDIVENTSSVLEEILSLSRDNQKLLRNSGGFAVEEFEKIFKKFDRVFEQSDKNTDPKFFYDLLLFSDRDNKKIITYNFLIAVSFLKEDFPWIYDLGKGLFDILSSNKSLKQKVEAIKNFQNMLEYSLSHLFEKGMAWQKIGKNNNFWSYDLIHILVDFSDKLSRVYSQ
ncbi:MAG: toll/interleukin-1 receptor domain-containing protein [Defluviitaleaceae bacterium]|nr:toll/interleukin-1 receptor domain-containing protein [Defluviitaleaceae bacterium]